MEDQKEKKNPNLITIQRHAVEGDLSKSKSKCSAIHKGRVDLKVCCMKSGAITCNHHRGERIKAVGQVLTRRFETEC